MPRAAVAGAVPRGTTGGREWAGYGALLLLLLLLHGSVAGSGAVIVLVAFVDALAAIDWSVEPGCCARCPSPSQTCRKVRHSSEIATPPPRRSSVSGYCVVTSLMTWWSEKTQVTGLH